MKRFLDARTRSLLVGALSLSSLPVLAACGSGSSGTSGGGGGAGGAGQGGGGAGTVEASYTFETYNVALAGSFLPFEAERRAVLPAELAAIDADVICVQEAWQQADKEAIVAGVAGAFPHTAHVLHDQDTPLDDATDETGAVPDPFDTAPCGTDALTTALNNAMDCLATNCNTDAGGSDDGFTTSTDCAQEFCTSQVSALLVSPDPAAKRCYGCIASSLPDSPFSEIRDDCANNVNGGLAFNGQSSLMILSKHPLEDVEVRVVPGTWNRRIFMAATMVPGDGRPPVDVYCNHLTPVFDSITFPYTGQYGKGSTGKSGWAAEQLLQANKLVAWVAERSGEGAAVLLGDFNSGRDFGVGLIPEGPETFALLSEEYLHVFAPDYTPSCTYCTDNAINGGEDDEWIDHIFWSGPAPKSISSERTFDEPIVPATDDMGTPITVELSDHFGFRATITVDLPAQ
jgi:endonuclease/exonuclease/phosphatase family metal-dependent hydrolase